jgi:hypothetical protein
MELIKQKDQADLLVADSKYAPSKLCTVCGQPTRLGVVKCMHCLQAVYLAEELVYTRQWLRDHRDQQLVVGHDKHKLIHLALLRTPLLDVGWCGTKVTQKRDKRTLIKRHELTAAMPERFCDACLAAWNRMGLV